MVSILSDTNQLDELGYLVLPIPSEITAVLKGHIVERISSLGSGKNVDEIVMNLDEESFREDFKKTKRFFPKEICDQVWEWGCGFKSFLDFNEWEINYAWRGDASTDSAFQGVEELPEGQRDCFWRCVRPSKDDVGFAHRDSDFWVRDAQAGTAASCGIEYTKRWKVWIPLLGCNQENSLQVVPRSHREEVPVFFTSKACGVRPGIDDAWLEANEYRFTCPFDSLDGKAIFFHDDLVHRGPKNFGEDVRISAEFHFLHN